MTNVFLRLLPIALVVGCAEVGSGTALAADGDAAKGKAQYEKLCVACHGAQGKGDGPVGQALKPAPADFTSAASKKKSPADLRKVIEEGKPGTAMIGWKGQLSADDITDLLAYLGSLRK